MRPQLFRLNYHLKSPKKIKMSESSKSEQRQRRSTNKNQIVKNNFEDFIWVNFLKPFFFSFDPENVHHLVVNLLKFFKPVLFLRSKFYSFKKHEQKKLKRKLFGINFPNPVGLAAGFDKNAELIDQMSQIGFGFVEIGTVTPLPQSGNPKKRLFRLENDQALINRLGFNNIGVDKVVDSLKKNKNVVIGGNIGKNKITTNENAKNDYLICFKKLYNYVDYFAINVSSPNTPNLRELQNADKLRSILIPILKENKSRSNKPILLKISPDLSDFNIKNIVELSMNLKLNGIICTNTTIQRENLKSKKSLSNETGGLSGRPLQLRSNEIIRMIKKFSNGTLPIIGVGGILSPRDAIEKLDAGASLIQIYTGFIYNGPSFVYKINKEILKTLN